MLKAISVELAAALALRKVPYRVVYGPEKLEGASLTEPRIVIERDRKSGDQVTAPRGQSAETTLTTPNPRVLCNRVLGCTCRVFAKSTIAGAQPADHERVADQVIDQVLVALRTVVGGRRNTLTLGGGKILSNEELAALGVQLFAGVVYEQSFSVDRGVTDGPYAGESTAAFGTVPGAGVAIMGTDITAVATTEVTTTSPGTSETLPDATTRIDP